MSVNVLFPEELLVASREDAEVFSRKVMIYTLGHLYEQGKISSGVGAEVLHCDRVDFYRILSENGFSVIDYSRDEFDTEAQTSQEIARRLKDK